MIVVNNSNSEVRLDRYRFKPNVPTFFINGRPDLVKKLESLADFSLWDPDKDPLNYAKDKILVKLPLETNLVIACLKTIDRIRESYPTCDIFTTGIKEYKCLLPNYVQVLTNPVTPTEEWAYYYVFDLRIKNPVTKAYVDNEINKRLSTLDKLFMQASGLWDPVTDQKIDHRWLKIPKAKEYESDIVLIGSNLVASELHNVLKEITTKLELKVEFITTYRLLELENQINVLNNSKLNIFSDFDFQLAYISTSLHVPTLLFSPRTKPTSEETQISKFSNCKIAMKENYATLESDRPKFIANITSYIKERLGLGPERITITIGNGASST